MKQNESENILENEKQIKTKRYSKKRKKKTNNKISLSKKNNKKCQNNKVYKFKVRITTNETNQVGKSFAFVLGLEKNKIEKIKIHR
jgi:hypothetical protein